MSLATVDHPLTSTEILKYLPHRFPFLLVDKIIAIDPPPGKSWVGRKCTGIKNVTFNEPFFAGHFPDRPIMPGVMIVEAMAQVAAILGYRAPNGVEMEVLIAAIQNAKFRKTVVPGDTLRIEVQVEKDRGQIFQFECKSFVENELVCEATILAFTAPRKD